MSSTTPPPPDTSAAAQPYPPPSLRNSPLAKRPKTNNSDDNKLSSPTATPATTTAAATTTTTSTTTPAMTASPSLQVKKLTPNARAPTRGSAFSAGYDLYCAADETVPARDKALVSTGLAIAVPDGCYGRVAPRSGLAAKNFIDTGAGVIDADYRGEVKVLLFNFSDADFAVREGDRIAQLVLEKIYTPEVAVVEELSESGRGAGGFGSTGN